jgi:uncharacterized repeat protein (TIGR03803 family)
LRSASIASLAAIVLASFVGAGVAGSTSYQVVSTLPPAHGASGKLSVPITPLLFTPDGYAYGTTCNSHRDPGGYLYRMAPDGSTAIVHEFSESEGACPYGPLVIGTDGAIYGCNANFGPHYGGTIFRFDPAASPPSDGTTVFFAFNPGTGRSPRGLTLGSDGNFYGIAAMGGANDSGLLFRLTPTGVYTPLHEFDPATEGVDPQWAPLQAADGFLYATTWSLGPNGRGAVLRMSLDGTTTLMHAFPTDRRDGRDPVGLTIGDDGALYGTTMWGGGVGDRREPGQGTLYRLDLDGRYDVIHRFSQDIRPEDGFLPQTVPVADGNGHLLVSTNYGGALSGGTILRVSQDGSAPVRVMHNFAGAPHDASGAAYLSTDQGRLFGVSVFGGKWDLGAIWMLAPR